MPKGKIKNKQDRWIPAVIACLVLVGAAIWASVLIPEQKPEAELPRGADTTFDTQVLGQWEGKLARFTSHSDTPAQIYDVPIASLPEDVQQQLSQGITVTSEEQLVSLLENFTS